MRGWVNAMRGWVDAYLVLMILFILDTITPDHISLMMVYLLCKKERCFIKLLDFLGMLLQFCLTSTNTMCDYAVYISGDSMQPTIPDRSIALVKFEPNIQIGDVGIFNLNSCIYCKQLDEASLVSFNENYPPVSITEYDDFSAQGKVVEIIAPSEISEQVEFL